MFQPIKISRVSDAAVNQIRRLIEEGELEPGQQLPPERELVQKLSVSRNSVREALRILEAIGLVQVRPGVGTFVSENAIRDPAIVWSSWLEENQDRVLELLEVRRALEPHAAALATISISSSELIALEETLSTLKLAADQGDVQLAVEGDQTFHELMFRATGNSLLMKLGESVNNAMVEARYAFFQDPENIRASRLEHARILEAIKSGDQLQARKAMLAHTLNPKDLVRYLPSEGVDAE